MPRRMCICQCHNGTLAEAKSFRHREMYMTASGLTQNTRNWEGVDILSALEAAVACSACRAFHCPALLSRVLANDAEPSPPAPWVDPPRVAPPRLPPGTPTNDEGDE